VASDIGLTELVEGVSGEKRVTRLRYLAPTLAPRIGLDHLRIGAVNYVFNGKPAKLQPEGMRPLLYARPQCSPCCLAKRCQSERIAYALVYRRNMAAWTVLEPSRTSIEQVVGEIEDEHDNRGRSAWAREAGLLSGAKPKAASMSDRGIRAWRLSAEETDEEIDTLGGSGVRVVGTCSRHAARLIPHDSRRAVRDRRMPSARKIKRIRVRLSGAAPCCGG